MYDRMKTLREYYDNTQNEIAEKLDVSRFTYAGWENNIDFIPLDKLNDFCNYYHVSLDYICKLSDIKTKEILNDKIDINVLANNLLTIRKKHNDTQEKIAGIIKVDQSNYSKYEKGKFLIHTLPLIEFAKYYNVSMDYLCGKTQNEEIY